MRVLCEGVGVQAGLSRFLGAGRHEPIVWTLPGRETAMILRGSARIQIEGGPTVEAKAGDSFSLPGGVRTTWDITLPFLEFWVIEEADGDRHP
jgi:quercetin dioxygenase-like cupin family protein